MLLAPGRWLGLLAALAAAAPGGAGVFWQRWRPSPATASHDFPAGQRQLFVDGVGVAKIQGLSTTMHTADKKGAVIRPHGLNGTLQIRTYPQWVPERSKYMLVVMDYPIGRTTWFSSSDLVQWSPEATLPKGQPGSHYMNIYDAEARQYQTMTPLNGVHHQHGSPYDCGDTQSGAAVSADGLSWTAIPAARNVCPTADEQQLSFDPSTGRYLYTVKRYGPYGRSVALATSTNFSAAHWTDYGVVYSADALDQHIGAERIRAWMADKEMLQPFCNWEPVGKGGPCYNESKWNVDMYNMGAFAYESVYIGFPLMYHAFGPDGANTDGFHVIELAVSRNLRNWTRLGPRIPKRSWDNNVFIPNSRMGAGAYDLLGVSSPSAAVTLGDTLYMFYTAIRYRAPDMAPAELACADCPSGVRPADQGAINLATLRRDGWVSLDAETTGRNGTVQTKAFRSPGTSLFVNADLSTPGARLVVELLSPHGAVLAQSGAMSGDLLREQVEWRSGQALAKGAVVALRFVLSRGASLYSYWVQ